MGKASGKQSEPGLLLVCEISRAEFLLKDFCLFAAAQDLQGDENDKDEQEHGLAGPDDDARNKESAEDIDRISNA